MVRLLLSQRQENARETCAKCVNCKPSGMCKYPIALEWYGDGSVRIARLISFSEDGLTCQLFREPINKEVKE